MNAVGSASEHLELLSRISPYFHEKITTLSPPSHITLVIKISFSYDMYICMYVQWSIQQILFSIFKKEFRGDNWRTTYLVTDFGIFVISFTSTGSF